MKSFICIALLFVATIFSAVLASPVSNGSPAASDEHEAKVKAESQAANLESFFDMSRFRKAAYGGGATISAPPCPRNYLFSCQPNLAPVACAAPAGGQLGAYSAPVPTYVTYGVPHPVAYANYENNYQ